MLCLLEHTFLIQSLPQILSPLSTRHCFLYEGVLTWKRKDSLFDTRQEHVTFVETASEKLCYLFKNFNSLLIACINFVKYRKNIIRYKRMFLSWNKEKHNNLLKFNIHNLWSECSIFRHLIYRNTVFPEVYTNIPKKYYISAIL